MVWHEGLAFAFVAVFRVSIAKLVRMVVNEVTSYEVLFVEAVTKLTWR